MNTYAWSCENVRVTVAGIAAGIMLLVSPCAMAGEPSPDQIRGEIRKLEQKAKELKADGNEEKAAAVAREAGELREKLARMEKERVRERSGDTEHRAALERKLDESRAEFRELREAGKADRAEEVAKRIHKLEEELARAGQPRDGQRDAPPQRERVEVEQRMQHMREAIEHLHAAGMHEMAERLAQEARRMHQQMADGQREGRERQPEAEIERMRAEMQELRQAVRQLNARLDEQSRERK